MKFIYIIIVTFLTLGAHSEFRIWESAAGDLWEGEFITMNGKLVVIMDQSGKKRAFDPNALSETDREYLEKVIPPSLKVEVSRSVDSISSGAEMVRCIATIKKSDTQKYKGELTAVLVMLAEELRTGVNSKAGSSKEFKFTLPEKHGVPVKFESNPYRFLKRSNNSGRVYSGYVLVVWDRFGNPVAVKSNRDSFAEKAIKIARPKPTLNK